MLCIETRELFDGHALRGPARVVLEGERIVSVTALPEDGAGVPAADLRCAFAMPGLIDGHVHISGYSEGMPNGHPFEPMKSFLRLCGLTGITAVRDLGNSLETIGYVKRWSERFDGPRIFAAGPLLDAPPLRWSFSRLTQTPEEAEVEVDRLAFEGVDWLKAYRSIDPELLATIVATGRRHGLPVAIDCGASTALEAARAGVRSIEHAANLRARECGEEIHGSVQEARAWSGVEPEGAAYRELSETLLQHGTYICPTLLVSRRHCLLEEVIADPYLDFAVPVMPYHRHFKRMRTSMGMRMGRRYVHQYMGIAELAREEREQVVEGLDRMGRIVAALQADGVPVVAGTDTPNPSLAPGFSLHEEMAAMAAAGMPLPAVLESATGRAGELLGDPALGVLREGTHADVLCLDGDASADLDALGRIREVFVRGRRVDREGLRDKLQAAMEAVEAAAA